MFKIICVTNRGMCGDFFERIKKLYECGVTVILREKDLSENEYERLAKSVIDVCPNVILHSYPNSAKHLGVTRIHLPLRMMNDKIRNDFQTAGVSVHSRDEAVFAEKMGADYVTAGHIFATDCKKGLAPRGVDFLRDVCKSVKIPVYAIGGITPENIMEVKKTGAAGACIMSGFMQCGDVGKYMQKIWNLYSKTSVFSFLSK